MFANVYKDKKVFITGHTGFKGSWLAAWLASLGAELGGFADSVPTSPSNFEEWGLATRMRDIRGDIRDRKTLCSAMRDFAPDIVFHLAAQAQVGVSYREPALTFETNVMGTLNTLEAVRNTPSVKAVVCITSDRCYRNNGWVWSYREQDPLGGEEPYGASKSCAEIVAHSYFKSFFKDGPACATVRAGNVIGGGDWALERFVPDCARAWSEGNPAQIRSPHATRPWQHVLEPLSGYLWLGARLMGEVHGVPELAGEAYNFGPAADMNKTEAEVAEALTLHWPGFHSVAERESAAGMKEDALLKLCCDKVFAGLGWKATLDFEECIRYTAEWYRAYYAPDRPDMRAFTLGQIFAYSVAAEARGQPWAG